VDFSNAQLQELKPLQHSFTVDDIESDLNRLIIDLFKTYLASNVFDVNVLGAAHLGTFDLVRKSVNADGLVLLQGDREEAATRYLYRAWKSKNNDGRGLHFLRTYLQMLFPNTCEVTQLWHDKTETYPNALFTGKPRENFWLFYLGEPGLKLNGSWGVGGKRQESEFLSESTRVRDLTNAYLTSRIEISMGFETQIRQFATLLNIIRAIIPARLLPIFKFWLKFILFVDVRTSESLVMRKKIQMRQKWCGRVVTDHIENMWKLGRDGVFVKLPQAFGTFRVGEKRGGLVEWHLRNCRIVREAIYKREKEATVWRLENLALNPIENPPEQTRLKLSGLWKLGGIRNPEFTFNTTILV